MSMIAERDTIATISPDEAYAIASQWGSYLSTGDPGAVFYTFPCGDASPQSADHKAELLAYTDELLARQDLVEDDEQDLSNLRSFFVSFTFAENEG